MEENNEMIKNDHIIPVKIDEEMKSSYIDYSMSVIVSRALPDVRDGFKPVHRRVLFGMNELGNTSDKPTKKSARIVGEVMGKYHPHGDSSIYGTLVRMAQPWAMRYCLVDGQGNFGSVDGDGAAAMRYTEARLSKLAEEMLRDIVPGYARSVDEGAVKPLAARMLQPETQLAYCDKRMYLKQVMPAQIKPVRILDTDPAAQRFFENFVIEDWK